MKDRTEFKPDIFVGDSVGQGLPLMQLIGKEGISCATFSNPQEQRSQPHLEGCFQSAQAAFGRVKRRIPTISTLLTFAFDNV